MRQKHKLEGYGMRGVDEEGERGCWERQGVTDTVVLAQTRGEAIPPTKCRSRDSEEQPHVMRSKHSSPDLAGVVNLDIKNALV